jgi:hypothetical protein
MSSNNNVIKEMKKIINEKSDFRTMPLPRSFANTVSTLLTNIDNNKKNAKVGAPNHFSADAPKR